MSQPLPATPSPSPTELPPTPPETSTSAWVSLGILGILNAIAAMYAFPTLALIIWLAANSDRGGISVMGLPEFFYVPAQFLLFLPSLVIVIVATIRGKLSLGNKMHVGLMLISALILLADIVGLIIMLTVIMA